MENYFFKYISLFALLLAACKSQSSHYICKTITIRSSSDFNLLENCTTVAGYVQLVEFDFNDSDLANIRPSRVEEITSYLVVYNVGGLDSLERLFPNLVVIRGAELLFDEYGLVVVENRDLVNVGLVSLLRVLKGSIRIEHNPSLCFVNTINWAWILGSGSKRYYYDLKHNKPDRECPLCYTYKDELEVKDVNRHKRCWSHNRFQKRTPQNCKTQSNCLTTCSNVNCRLCKNYMLESGCTDLCLPPNYKIAFKRQCVADCTRYGLVQFGIECIEACPKYFRKATVNGVQICELNCSGDIVIHNTEDLEGLEECQTINGSLTIEIDDTEKPIVQHLERAFSNLNVITGYLKIVHSPQITSLQMFKNLHTILGSKLLENKYSLYVVSNHYLQELWHQNVMIVHGCVYFHFNSLLCFEVISSLKDNFKECPEMTITDVSRSSNGEEAVCGEDRHIIKSFIADISSDSVLIEIEPVKSTYLSVLLGYAYYYKEAPFKNVTKYVGRHGCGIDEWFTDVTMKIHRRNVLRNLKPGTQYAYYVESVTIPDYYFADDFITEVDYFTTTAAQPEKVAKMFYHSVSGSEIDIHWWPPRITNGILDEYILQYELINDTRPLRNQSMSQDCKCPKLEAESHVPSPHPSSYYNKEEIYYIDAVLNRIFVKKMPSTDNRTATVTNDAFEPDIFFIYIDATAPARSTDESNTAVINDSTDIAVVVHSTSTPKTVMDLEIKKLFDLAQMKLEVEALKLQDGDMESYKLTHPPPICHHPYPIMKQQTQQNCIPQQKFHDAIVIPANQHSFTMSHLEPEKSYRISLRACVKNLLNGCGPPKVIIAQTLSKRLETIIENFEFNKFGMVNK